MLPKTYILDNLNLEEFDNLVHALTEYSGGGDTYEGVLNDAFFFDLGSNAQGNITFTQRDQTPYTTSLRRYAACYYQFADSQNNTLHALFTDDEDVFEDLRQDYLS